MNCRSRQQVLLLTLILGYVWGAVLGNFVHGLLHHLDTRDHQHSLPCVTKGLIETPADEALGISQVPAVTAGNCNFKLALHNLNRPVPGGSSQPALLVPTNYDCQAAARATAIVWRKDILW